MVGHELSLNQYRYRWCPEGLEGVMACMPSPLRSHGAGSVKPLLRPQSWTRTQQLAQLQNFHHLRSGFGAPSDRNLLFGKFSLKTRVASSRSTVLPSLS